MLSIAINSALILPIIYRYIHNKSNISLILLFFTVGPRIQLGTMKIDGTYILIVLLAVAIIIKQRWIIIAPKAYLKKYIYLIAIVHLIYFISWLEFNRNSANEMILIEIGALKHIVLIIELYVCNRNIIGLNIKKEISGFILLALLINLSAVAYEIIDYNGAVNLLSTTFLNETETLYLIEMVKGNAFSRYYGVFSYPMRLGMFSCHALAFLLFDDNSKGYKRIVEYVIIMGLGLLSGSKSFIIGAALVLFAFMAFNIFTKSIGNKQILAISSVLLTIVLVSSFYDQIYELIYNYIGPTCARYFGFLKNYNEIFNTRFGTDSGQLIQTFNVFKEYWLLGVGPVSLLGEPVSDNAYLSILHNGGITAFIITAAFYISVINKSRLMKDVLLCLVAVIVTGMGFQTIIAADSSFWIIFFILWQVSICYKSSEQKNDYSYKMRFSSSSQSVL